MSKINYLLILSIFLGLTSFATSNKSDDEREDKKIEVSSEVLPTSSRILWKGFKPMGEHTGEIKIKSGNLLFIDTLLTGGEIVVDMSSITCTDIEEVEKNAKLISHLKSADFFDVDSFNTATLVIKKTIPYGAFETKQEESTGQVYKAIADLTIKEITKEIKFQIKLYQYNDGNGYVSASSRIEIDRSDFDVKYGSGSFFEELGDKIIYDEFRLDISISSRLK